MKFLNDVKKSQTKGSVLFTEKLNKMFSSGEKSKTKSKIIFQLENLEITDLESYEIFSSYDVGECKVYICKNSNGKTFYLISEPTIDKIGKAMYAKIMRFLYVVLPSDVDTISSMRIFLKKKIIDISRKLKIDPHTIPILDTLLY